MLIRKVFVAYRNWSAQRRGTWRAWVRAAVGRVGAGRPATQLRWRRFVYRVTGGRYGHVTYEEPRLIRHALEPVLAGLPAQREGTPRVLVASMISNLHEANLVEGLIATGLRLRGADVRGVACDRTLSGCDMRTREPRPPSEWEGRGERCQSCYAKEGSLLDAMGLPMEVVSRYIAPEGRREARARVESLSLEEILRFEYRGQLFASQVKRGLTRFYLSARFEDRPDALRVGREYLYSAILLFDAFGAILEAIRPEVVLLMSPDLLLTGIPYLAAIARGVRVMRWHYCYYQEGLVLEPGQAGPRGQRWDFTGEAWPHLARTALTPDQEQAVDRAMSARMGGRLTREGELRGPAVQRKPALAKVLGLRPEKPWAVIYAHQNEDVGFAEFEVEGYRDSIDWLVHSVRLAMQNDAMEWVVRLHPTEVTHGHRSTTLAVLKQEFPSLPPHVRLMLPDEPVSPYELMQAAQVVVTFFGTAGSESALLGKPAIIGASWADYGDKGFTYDARSREEYAQLLRRAHRLPRLTPHQIDLARRYTFFRFLQRGVGGALLNHGWIIPPDFPDRLGLGRDADLDLICRAILHGGPRYHGPRQGVRPEAGELLATGAGGGR